MRFPALLAIAMLAPGAAQAKPVVYGGSFSELQTTGTGCNGYLDTTTKYALTVYDASPSSPPANVVVSFATSVAQAPLAGLTFDLSAAEGTNHEVLYSGSTGTNPTYIIDHGAFGPDVAYLYLQVADNRYGVNCDIQGQFVAYP